MSRATMNEHGELLCGCGNEPGWHGFEPCHEDGTIDDTLLSAGSTRLVYYYCNRCAELIPFDMNKGCPE